jgi:WD40 repeat protein
MSEERERTIRVLTVGDHPLRGVAWSPDGAGLAVGSDDGVEVVTPEGRQLWRAGQLRWIECVHWSPDGARLVSGGVGGVRVWDAADGRPLLHCDAGATVWSVAWSPDGRRLAWGTWFGNPSIVRVARAADGEVLLECRGHERWISAVAFAPGGGRLASGDDGGAIRIWDAAGSELRRLEGHTGTLRGLAWSPDGARLASGSRDSTVRIWDAAEGHCLLECQGHQDDVNAVDWSPCGRIVASAGSDRTVRLWSTESGRELLRLEGHTGRVWGVAFDPEGGRLASADAARIELRLWDIADLVPPRAAAAGDAALGSYVVRQAATVGRRPAAAETAPGWAPRLSGAAGHCVGLLGTEPEAGARDGGTAGRGVALWSGGRRLATGDRAGVVRAWDLAAGAPLWEADAEGSKVNDLAADPAGARLAAAHDDGVVRMLDADTGRVLVTCRGHTDWAFRVRWSPDGGRLASSSSDRTVRVWDAHTGQCLRQCEPEGSAWGLDWSADGCWLAAANWDGRVLVWDADSGGLARRIEAHRDMAFAVAWSPDGRRLASAGQDRLVQIWDAATGGRLATCSGHTSDVHCAAWSPCGRRLASAGVDGTVRVWDPETGRELERYEAPAAEAALRVCWAAGGGFLASAHLHDRFRLWDARRVLEPAADAPAPPAGPLPAGLQGLPAALAALQRGGRWPALGLARDLLTLTAGGAPAHPSLAPLADHSGIRALVALHWPEAARIGLAALLLRGVPGGDDGLWRPPPGVTPAEAAKALAAALAGSAACPPAEYPTSAAALAAAAAEVDDRLLTLLELLGPAAVAADPSLPLRLLHRLPALPPLSAARRPLLALRLSLEGAGAAQGRAAGAERSGIQQHGDLRALLPSQLALPEDLFRWRHSRGELLYRASRGQEPPRWRPTVLLLDVSPPTYGPVEALTRPAAPILAASLVAAGQPVVLVTAGGRGTTRPLEQRRDLVDLWTARSSAPAEAAGALRAAWACRAQLGVGPDEPLIVALTHAYFGAEEVGLPRVPGLRGLFVQYPGQQVRPALAAQCERWESVPAGSIGSLVPALTRLLE